MPDNITDEQVADSSAADTQGANAADSPAVEPTDDPPADSSPAEGENEPSAIDLVDKALGTEGSPDSEDENREAESKDSEPKKDEVEDDLPDDPTEDELKDVHPKTRQRIESLVGQRKDLEGQVETLKPQAEQWAQVEQFREAQGLKPEHVANAIQIAALIENEPGRAFEVVGRLHEMLSTKVGASLSEDLREAVKTGEITRDRAFELSKARASGRVSEEQRAAETERREAKEQSTRLTEQTRVAADTSTAWDKNKSTSDPDWNLKRDEVAKRVELRLRAEGIPASAEDMRKVLDEETKSVETFAGQFRPAGRPLQPTPSSASPRGAAPQAPKDHYDVVEQALGG